MKVRLIEKEPTTVTILDFNPALHPRDPDTGKFVERPFNIPDDLLSDAERVSDIPAEEIVSRVDIPSNVTVDGFDGEAQSANIPDNPQEGAEAVADNVLQAFQEESPLGVSRDPPDREQLVDNWSEILSGGFENQDEELISAIGEAQQQNQNNEEYQSIISQTDTPDSVIHIDPEAANETGGNIRFSEAAQAERKGATTFIYSQELGTKSTEPIQPTPEDSVSSKDVASIIRHEAAHGVWDQIGADTREELSSAFREIDTSQITGYANTNGEEAFTEIMTVMTNPKFDPDAYPSEVIDVMNQVRAVFDLEPL